MESRQQLASLLAFNDGNWVAYTPAGYYNGSEKGSQYVSWRMSSKVYDFDQFFDKYFRPEVIPEVLQNKKVTPEYTIAAGFATPPEVRILTPGMDTSVTNPELEIKVQAKDLGGGIDDIRLYQNGKVISPGQRGLIVKNKTQDTVSYRVLLADGNNTFRAIAFSKDRTESRPFELAVTLLAPKREAALYMLVVGVNEYKNSSLNLNFAVPDAEAIARYYEKNGPRLFREVNITRVFNADATRANVLTAFQKLREKAKEQDVVILYFSGHGDSSGSEWYFIPYDVTRPEAEDDVRSASISSTMMSSEVTQMRSQKVLLLIDACKSGSVLVSFRGYEDRKA